MKLTTDEVSWDYLLRAPHNYQINSPLNSDFGDIEVKAGKGDSIAEQHLKMLSRLHILKMPSSLFSNISQLVTLSRTDQKPVFQKSTLLKYA